LFKKITPIRFDGYMQSGGSTKPWRVVAIDTQLEDLKEVAYVVKTYTAKNITQGHSIAKEFICNALAGQFDLAVPTAYFIDLHDTDFISTLEQDTREVLSGKYNGVTFASELLDATIINEQLKGPFTITDCATLFAFDCLILNTDRGGWRNKPNLLVDDEGFILIDHELAFHIIDTPDSLPYYKVIEHLNNSSWINLYSKHIFYARLKTYRGSKKHLFDTFEQSLLTLDINYINRVISNLTANQIDIGSSAFLIEYLSGLKENTHRFINTLLSLIS